VRPGAGTLRPVAPTAAVYTALLAAAEYDSRRRPLDVAGVRRGRLAMLMPRGHAWYGA
jgi:hypothetical protein